MICHLKDSKGDIISERGAILKEQAKFYQDLYTTNLQETQDFYLDRLESPKLTDREILWLDRVIDMDKLSTAMRQLKNNKSPGSDGLPVEFYKKFWSLIDNILYNVYQEGLQDQLHLSAQRGFIILLEKSGKDPLLLTNWRPLTLLNIDFEILSKVLVNRIQVVLPTIIHKHQSRFMKGRYMGENLFELVNIIEFCEQEKIDALLVSFNFQKAFDMVE